MFFDRFRYELKLMGKKVILTPILVVVGFGLVALFLHYIHSDGIRDRFLSASLEMILPLAAGVIVATIVGQEPALELQLTMPIKYSKTVVQRLGLVAGWSICVALLSSVLIARLDLSYTTEMIGSTLPEQIQFLIGQLAWFAPLCWCAGFGLCIALLSRSRAACAAILSAIWVFEVFFKDFLGGIVPFRPLLLFPTTLYRLTRIPSTLYSLWLANRLEVVVTALAFLLIGLLLLRQSEGLLKGASEE